METTKKRKSIDEVQQLIEPDELFNYCLQYDMTPAEVAKKRLQYNAELKAWSRSGRQIVHIEDYDVKQLNNESNQVSILITYRQFGKEVTQWLTSLYQYDNRLNTIARAFLGQDALIYRGYIKDKEGNATPKLLDIEKIPETVNYVSRITIHDIDGD